MTGSLAKARRSPATAAAELLWYDNPRRRALPDTDALGLYHLEDRIASWFWPGFTTRTTRVGCFVLVLYGLSAADAAAERYGLPRDDDTLRFLFSRFERLWGMGQVVASESAVTPPDIMFGADGIIAAYESHGQSLPLDFLHLQQQEVGALGAYLASLRAHRLVAADRLRLTPIGWDLAQLVFCAAGEERPALHELVLRTLDPKNKRIPQRAGRATLEMLGERTSLAQLRANRELTASVSHRLFAERASSSPLAILPRMAAFLRQLHAEGITAPEQVLTALAEGRLGSSSHPLSHPAKIALTFTALGRTMLQIFDRMHQVLLASGYAAEWSDCVQASVTDELVEQLTDELMRWTRLGCNERLGELSAVGRTFSQIMHRFNTQNRYNIFESVLNLHTGSHRALGRGEGWIGRSGETMVLRQASTDLSGSEAERFRPSFRLASARELLLELTPLEQQP